MEELPKESLRYNEGKPDWTLLHYKSLLPLVDVMAYGAHKYSVFQAPDGSIVRGIDIASSITSNPANGYTLLTSGRDNWKIGFDPRKVLKSLMRHVIAYSDGEEFDQESGLPHIGHALANLMFMQYHTDKLNQESDGTK